jgi:DNA-binding FadR family transcriptional regulator
MAKRPSVSQRVQQYIREYIITHKLRPGDPLPPEGQIAAELEVSRISAREGVKVLQAVGVLEVRHGDGLFVRGLNLDALLEMLSYNILLDLTSLHELHYIRKWFAVGMVPDVIRNIRPEDIETCRTYLKEWEKHLHSGQVFYEQDRQFHLTLCRSLNNALMLELENIFWSAYSDVEDTANSLHVSQEEAPAILQSHRDILAAIEARNVELAQQLMAKSFEEFERRWKLFMQRSQKSAYHDRDNRNAIRGTP